MEFRVSGYNIFDKDYTDSESDGMIYYDIPQAGRTWEARLTYKF